MTWCAPRLANRPAPRAHLGRRGPGSVVPTAGTPRVSPSSRPAEPGRDPALSRSRSRGSAQLSTLTIRSPARWTPRTGRVSCRFDRERLVEDLPDHSLDEPGVAGGAERDEGVSAPPSARGTSHDRRGGSPGCCRIRRTRRPCYGGAELPPRPRTRRRQREGSRPPGDDALRSEHDAPTDRVTGSLCSNGSGRPFLRNAEFRACRVPGRSDGHREGRPSETAPPRLIAIRRRRPPRASQNVARATNETLRGDGWYSRGHGC
jgi:hypothetical protein